MHRRCTLWSPMQNINIKDEHGAQLLQSERELDQDTHLMMCRRLYLGQVRRGNHARIEHPERCKAWSTSASKTLPGYHALFNQCAYGATTKDDNGFDAFIRKSTALHTTKRAMAMRMSRRCDHTHDHQPLEGRIPGTSISRCRAAEDYCLTLAQHFAHGMMAEETLDDQVFAADEAGAQHAGVLRQLAAEHGDGPARVAIKLHRNLGHPRKEVLLKILEEKGASDKVKRAVQSLQCPQCSHFGSKKTLSPAHLERATQFGEAMQADTLWIENGKKKVAVLSMVDEATRFMAARVIHDEMGKNFTTAIERAWVRNYGPICVC